MRVLMRTRSVVSDPDKIKLVPLKAAACSHPPQAKTIDLLVRNTTWNLMREVVFSSKDRGSWSRRARISEAWSIPSSSEPIESGVLTA